MVICSQLGMGLPANENHLYPEYAFAAKSLIRQRIGFYEKDVFGIPHCEDRIQSAMFARDHYDLSDEEYRERIASYLDEVEKRTRRIIRPGDCQ
jgi:hypothetical protein